MEVNDPQIAEVAEEMVPEPNKVETNGLPQGVLTSDEKWVHGTRKDNSYRKHEILPVKSERGDGRVYVKASVNNNEEMALLDTGATLSAISESMAAYSIDPKLIAAPDLEARSATNHQLEFTGKAKVLVQIGDLVIVPITLNVVKNFFRHLLFGIDFMNKSRASLSFPANNLTIDGQNILTKIG